MEHAKWFQTWLRDTVWEICLWQAIQQGEGLEKQRQSVRLLSKFSLCKMCYIIQRSSYSEAATVGDNQSIIFL